VSLGSSCLVENTVFGESVSWILPLLGEVGRDGGILNGFGSWMVVDGIEHRFRKRWLIKR
jgi:hypothetical protein